MKDSVIISSVSINLAQKDPLPVVVPDVDTAFGPFNIKVLDQQEFKKNSGSARRRHTAVSYRLSAMIKRLIEQAGFDASQIAGSETGLVSGSSYGCSAVFDMHQKLREYGPRGIDAVRFAQATHSYPISKCAIEFGLKGPSLALVSCEAAGMEALLCAYDWITENRCERVIVAAYEDFSAPVREHIIHSLGGKKLTGTVREAMVLIMVERKSAAIERGGVVLAEITGMATIQRNADATEYQRACIKAFGETRKNDVFGTAFAHRSGQHIASDIGTMIGGIPFDGLKGQDDFLGASGLVEMAQLISQSEPLPDLDQWFIGATSAFGGGVAAGVKFV